ncbi:mucoidy inhibitor MuiA family protein [Myxococcaceae bacterium JPH2]|nr:mucoidy inhibitor MuiA family protein [Myxococcaceae bacterium JPH2]
MFTLPLLPFLALTAAPTVSSVIVHPDRAQVTWAQDVACDGATTVVFEPLPSSAPPESFRASVQGASLVGSSVERMPHRAELARDLETWRTREQNLNRELAALAVPQARTQHLEQLARDSTDVAAARVTQELTRPQPDPRGWAAGFDVALELGMQGIHEARSLEEKRQALESQRTEALAELARLQELDARGEYRVEVRLTCPAASRPHVELSALLGGVSWVPTYEARADEAHQRVELTTLATVRQETGLDWTGARIFISTALPSEDATPPAQRPIYLMADRQPETQPMLVWRESTPQHAEVASPTPASDGTGLRVIDQGLSVQWEALEATTIPGDGTAVRVPLGRHVLAAEFSWRTVPQQRPIIYRVARMTNTTPFALLSGQVSVFRDSAFLGRHSLGRVSTGAPFELTFGQDEGLRVQRTVMAEVRNPLGPFSRTARFRYAYRFQLTNLHPSPETVVLSEHVPVSELEDVTVELEPQSTPGYSLAKVDGIAEWKVPLAPGETRTVDLLFHIEAPFNYAM